MTDDTELEELRDIDRAVLASIQDGKDDVQKITETTTLPNYKVNYSLEKLQDVGLIKVYLPEKVDRIIDGERQVFEVKTVELTEYGREYLDQADQGDIGKYQNLSHRELVEKVHELEQEVEELQQSFEIFWKQVQKNLD